MTTSIHILHLAISIHEVLRDEVRRVHMWLTVAHRKRRDPTATLRRPPAQQNSGALAGPLSDLQQRVSRRHPPSGLLSPWHLRLLLLPLRRTHARGELLAREHACSSPACAQKDNHADRLRPKDTTRMRERPNGDVSARVCPRGACDRTPLAGAASAAAKASKASAARAARTEAGERPRIRVSVRRIGELVGVRGAASSPKSWVKPWGAARGRTEGANLR